MDKENAVYTHIGILFSHKEITGKWIELMIIMLRKISQTEKKYFMFFLICRSP
jgi:hypothetical protein